MVRHYPYFLWLIRNTVPHQSCLRVYRTPLSVLFTEEFDSKYRSFAELHALAFNPTFSPSCRIIWTKFRTFAELCVRIPNLTFSSSHRRIWSEVQSLCRSASVLIVFHSRYRSFAELYSRVLDLTFSPSHRRIRCWVLLQWSPWEIITRGLRSQPAHSSKQV
jgi:hypothetical protein